MRSLILESLNLLFLLSLLSSCHNAASKSRYSLDRGDSISVGRESHFITSPDNSFTFGFYGLKTNAFWLAIWFTNTRDKTVVWMANRDRPVNSKGSRVKIRGDGKMILTDADGSVVWETNNISEDVAAAELLNTGNLVLKNQRGDVLWQSFDFPTDTLLPSQSFTKKTRLTCVSAKGSFAAGIFHLYFDTSNVLKLMSDSIDTSTNYSPNPDLSIYANGRTNYNSSRIAVLDDLGRFSSSDHLQFNASDMGYGIKRRMTIDYDGNLRVYSLNDSTGLWAITWQALAQPCNVKGV